MRVLSLLVVLCVAACAVDDPTDDLDHVLAHLAAESRPLALEPPPHRAGAAERAAALARYAAVHGAAPACTACEAAEFAGDHGWAAASLLEPAPRAPVTAYGVTFEPADLEALLQVAHDRPAGTMLGGACHGRAVRHDQPRAVRRACGMVDAAALHLVVTNLLGRDGRPFVGDRADGAAVWSQPLLGYRIVRDDAVAAERAADCTGDSPSPGAAAFHEIELEVDFAAPGDAAAAPGRERHHYVLETDAAGRVLRGAFCADSDARYEMLWQPISAGAAHPHLDLDDVRALVARSRGA